MSFNLSFVEDALPLSYLNTNFCGLDRIRTYVYSESCLKIVKLLQTFYCLCFTPLDEQTVIIFPICQSTFKDVKPQHLCRLSFPSNTLTLNGVLKFYILYVGFTFVIPINTTLEW
jgi:hypothetical protein